jgi:hypothetical protein
MSLACDDWLQVAACTALNLRNRASSSAAPLPASKRQKTQPGATRAVVSAESLGDEGDGASIAGGVLETQEEHERRHSRDEPK